MTKPVNLNRVRKERSRVKKRAEANENAVKYGLTKDQKEIEAARAEKARRALDAHKLEP